jgi:signal transduction histidine kinase
MIFAGFAQANSSIMRTYGSTGLGLAVASELVQRCAGKSGLKVPWGGHHIPFCRLVPCVREFSQNP